MDLPSRELTIEEFNGMIPGAPPTKEQQRQFYVPKNTIAAPSSGKRRGRHRWTHKVKNATREFDLHLEVTATVQSVLNAAGKAANKFHYQQIPPSHKATDRTNRPEKITVNSGGIYFDSGSARGTSTRRKKRQAASKYATGGCHSWDRLVVPFKINITAPTRNPGSGSRFNEPGKSSNTFSNTNTTAESSTTPRVHGSTDRGVRTGEASPSQSIPTPDHSNPEADSLGPTATLPDDSAFRYNGASFVRGSERGEDALAQLAEDMFDVFKFQHRISSWAVYVLCHQARLLYFDRAGAYVSQPFEWTTAQSLLHTFVWKLAHMSDVDLGYDPSATPPTKEELIRLDQAKNDLPLHPAVRRLVEEEMGNGYPLYKLCVTSYPTRAEDAFPDEVPVADQPGPSSQPASSSTKCSPADDSATWAERYFIVGRPQFAAETLTGRCTRGYIAYDLTDNAFYHLKDLWRSWVPGRSRPEHLVYERLHKYNVPGIAPLICGGDVGGPLTWVTDVQNALPAENRPVARVHYRIVTGTIGISLTSFVNFKELTRVLSGALATHHYAWERAKVLHHDISVGNILIDPKTRDAILIDWDSSRLECELYRPVAEPDRTGTWPFRSGLSLRYPYKPYCIADDIEAFVHVFLYLVLRFHPTSVENLLYEVSSRYQQYKTVNGIKVGGMRKIQDFSRIEAPFQVASNLALQAVLDHLAVQCNKSYSPIDHKYMGELYGLPEPEGNDPTSTSESDDEEDSGDEELPVDSDTEFDIPVAFQNHVCPKQCAIDSGLLSKHGNVVKVLKMYKRNADDKKEDQFEKRAHEALGILTQSQHIGHLSITCTIDLMNGGTSPARQSCPDHSTSGISYASTLSTRPSIGSKSMSGTRQAQKRRREQERAGMFGDRVEEGNSDVRPMKRRSTRKTRAASKTHG